MARTSSALLICAIALSSPTASLAGGEAAALAADDECAASEGAAGCTLNELQLRAAKVAAEAAAGELAETGVEAEAAAGELAEAGVEAEAAARELAETEVEAEAAAADSASGGASENGTDGAASARWVLGHVGASCSQACALSGMSCSPGDFRVATNWQTVWNVAAQAGAKCTMSWANDNRHGMGFTLGVPAVCRQSRCGADLPGTCAYDATPRSTCAGAPATGFQRLCPCSPRMAPGPHSQSYNYPHSAPAPYGGGMLPVPAPAPHYPHSAPAVPCEQDSGGTCGWRSCDKSRGSGVKCVKTSGKHKCICQAGYCAVKGVCKSAHR